jgi:MFS family permease
VPFKLFHDRNFSLMNWVSLVMSIGLMGIFLPFTIYLQSALGFSALKAGLVMAPSSIVSMFVAPVAGRMTDRIGGKWILFTGLLCFGLGMGLTAEIATTSSNWPEFIPSLAVAGFGMGCTFAPMTTTAMRRIEPNVAGAASGVINTVRQVGAVIGTAAVGALLQNRLASSLPAEAAKRAHLLPPQVRSHFIAGFATAANNGAAMGAGQSAHASVPPGTPSSVIARIDHLASEVFSAGYVTAMHLTMIMPIVLLTVAAISCLWIQKVGIRPRPSAGQADSSAVPQEAQAPA